MQGTYPYYGRRMLILDNLHPTVTLRFGWYNRVLGVLRTTAAFNMSACLDEADAFVLNFPQQRFED